MYCDTINGHISNDCRLLTQIKDIPKEVGWFGGLVVWKKLHQEVNCAIVTLR